MTTTPLVRRHHRDPVALAILKNRFEAIARKMAHTLLKTGRSGVLNTARDFSCGILTADGELVTGAECYPIHVLRGPDLMHATMKAFHPDLRPGDAVLHNSPYHGNTHAADHAIMIPVFDDRGRHRFTTLVKAHQADCGNSIPTTYVGTARDVYEEGAVIFPAVLVQRDYRDIDDIIRMCEMRIRVPEQWRGDYLASLGAARIGEQELLELGAERGWDALEDHTRAWFDYSERRMVSALGRLASGRAVAHGTHDAIPGTPPDGIRVQADVTIDAAAGRVTIDLTDNPDCMPNGLNLSQGCALSAAIVGIFNCIDHTVPPNAGSLRRLEVKLRENCCVGIPRHPTSVSVATTNLSDRLSCAVQRAVAAIDPRFGMADGGPPFPPVAGVLSGFEPDTGAPYCNGILFAGSGGPGNPYTDGWVTLLSMGNAGMPQMHSIEVAEIQHPVVIHDRAIVPDTGGDGRRRGAPGTLTRFGPTAAPVEVGYVSDGTVHPAEGVGGGLPGGPSRQWRVRADGSEEILPTYGQVVLQPGESLISITAAGGGCGDPLEREVERVAEDVAEGWVTPARARSVYAVVCAADGTIDPTATAAERAARRAAA
ncbi:hydantoinase B/oxoprolinase family protein [Prosthecomicrobium hirschii]|uniref:hydantoinase B/oxoprolinase family protein n=1 Tax=Prosthecodimorpha hirschii TaxID=665126 RepID=UPI002220E9CC|nr:hydantoinase B/oxoprolinase family protein [Prosthecomicrobium hirschii]MCW1838881.1 hydantoinase B/oxoprolinase family protein [Prosthecomicrobium hirschii]